jgi:hypothetical protein
MKHEMKEHKEHEMKEHKNMKGLHHVSLDTILPKRKYKDDFADGKFGSLPKGKGC